jgi:uncharacterized SAM-binding protein YcdF (DUF218 family)
MLSDQTEIRRITRYLDIQATPKHADVAFVFGSASNIPAQIAASLYQEGIVDYIVLTGGINRESGKPEAEKHLRVLIAEGIPDHKIIFESKSTNTKENVCLAREVMAEKLDLARIKLVVAVGKWYHSRRAVMTLKRFLPPGIRYFTVTYELHNIRRDNWWLNDVGRHYVLKEWNCIPRYLQKGDLALIQPENGPFV